MLNLRYQRITPTILSSILIIAAFTTIAAVGAAFAAVSAGPGETLVRETIASMVLLPGTVDASERRKLLDSIEHSLALESLARQSLGSQWDKIDQSEREHFVSLLTQNIETTLPQAAQALSTVSVHYDGEDRKPSGSLVYTTIARADGGKVPVDYVVAHNGARWQIADVNLDGESLSQAVAKRIQFAIAQDGYPKLVSDLSKRVTENTSREKGR